MGEVDFFLATLAEEFLDLITSSSKGGGLGRGLFGGCGCLV
jgi:hypothetical protein